MESFFYFDTFNRRRIRPRYVWAFNGFVAGCVFTTGLLILI
ncbi:hypothetical protein [Hydrocarboniphaga sp.]|nr:hypothetical protein [Hydrocarboniphaga sp.]